MKNQPLRLLYTPILVFVILFSSALPTFAQSTHWYVSPAGSGNHDGRSAGNSFATIQAGLVAAQPGDTIHLADGQYTEEPQTVRSGAQGAPITLIGSQAAILSGEGTSRVFQVFHDYITLDGFVIDGNNGANGDKLLFVQGTQPQRGPTGLVVRNMTLTRAGGECVRLRYFVTNADIHNNTITHCGYYDFVAGAGGKNGEGIYIGTADDQWSDGKNPTSDPDVSTGNWIHHNTFDTQGNECVETKEGATANIIEYNICTGNKDPNSAGLGGRGSGNIFRYNTTYGNVGAGIRVGGDLGYGTDNDIYQNTIYGNAGGGIKFQVGDQGTLCGNVFTGPNGETQTAPSTGSFGEGYAAMVVAPCAAQPPTPTGAPATATTAPATATSAPATVTPVATATATTPPGVTPTSTVTPGATITPTATVAATATPTATVAATAIPTATVTVLPTDQATAEPTPTVIETPMPPLTTTAVYLSFSRGGTVGGISYRDEDILRYDPETGEWGMYLAGRNLGIRGDIDALQIDPDGSILLSLDDDEEIPGIVGDVEASDIIRIDPMTGEMHIYLTGDFLGLTKDHENIDALARAPTGELLVSTVGEAEINGFEARDEDLIILLGDGPALYFDGSDVGLTTSSEDIWGASVDPTTGEIYLSTVGNFISLDYATAATAADVFACLPSTLGDNTACTSMRTVLRTQGIPAQDAVIDALFVGHAPELNMARSATLDPGGEPGDTSIDFDDTYLNPSAPVVTLMLPVVDR